MAENRRGAKNFITYVLSTCSVKVRAVDSEEAKDIAIRRVKRMLSQEDNNVAVTRVAVVEEVGLEEAVEKVMEDKIKAALDEERERGKNRTE